MMKLQKNDIKYRKGISFASVFTIVYMIVGAIGIILTDIFLSLIMDNYRVIAHYDGWLFLILTSLIMFYIALRFIYRDREHIKMLLEHRQKLDLYKNIFDKMSEGLIITNSDLEIISVNPSFQKITGFSKEEILGRKPNFLNSGMHSGEFYKIMWSELKENGMWQGEIINKRKNNKIFPEHLSISVIRDQHGAISNYIGIFTDLSNQRKAESEIEFLKHYDSLTRLPKHGLFMKHLNNYIENELSFGDNFSLFIIEVRKLKALNATKGYKVGDAIIKRLAARLQNTYKGWVLGRVNSKEFGIIVPHIQHHSRIEREVKFLLKEIENPISYQSEEVFITANIGISTFPSHGTTGEELYKNAEAAKTVAKENDLSYLLFGEEIQTNLKNKLSLEKYLMKALEKKEFEIYYQPQFFINNKQLSGLEALIRWNHPEIGLVTPGEFIPLAEENGLIIPIGYWIIETVCKQVKEWELEGYYNLKTAINISPKQLLQADFIEKVCRIFNATQIDPSIIEFEITENISLHDNDEMFTKIDSLKKLGVKISIDDFGTGHSSLSYLQKLPIDYLKIDRSFINHIPENHSNMVLTRAIIAMAHELNLAVIAEGIEKEEQLSFLHDLECEYGQGFLFNKPLSLNDVNIYLQNYYSSNETNLLNS